MESVAINTTLMPDGASSFHPHARRVGGFIYVSGIIASKRELECIPGVQYGDNGEIIGHDVVVQFESTLENLLHVLDEAGSSLERVFDVTVFLTNIDRDFKKFNEIYGKYFSEIMPARTTVEVSRLPSPVCLELKVIATVD